MDCTRRARSLRALILASTLLIPFSLAMAQMRGDGGHTGPGGGGGGRPGGRDGGMTPVDCPTACQKYADRIQRAALRMGASEEDAAARAAEALAKCQARCDGEPTEPPEPMSCEERAAAAAARCEARKGEDCTSVFLLTLAACKLREAEEPDTCRADCAKAAARVYEECREADDPPTRRECRQAANKALADCLAQCPAPPTCAERCTALGEILGTICGGENPPAGCANVQAILENCNTACEAPRPEPRPCTSACARVAEVLARLCEKVTPEEQKQACLATLAEFKTKCAEELAAQCAAEERVERMGFRKFMRGDVRRNRRIDLADAVTVLMGLFEGDGTIGECPDASDANDDGTIDLADAICILQHLFAGGRMPPPAGEEGHDGTTDGLACGEEANG